MKEKHKEVFDKVPKPLLVEAITNSSKNTKQEISEEIYSLL